MKVIKRDGRVVDFDREKISVAIEKANKEVTAKERANKQDIKDIIKYIEELDKKRILVEDIQDVIEEQLMDKKKFKLAKKYMIYRYNRALVRKKNTTDESILGLIKNHTSLGIEDNKNQDAVLASAQRDYIAGEVSKDLTKRILLPEKIVKAHEEGILYFHDMEYFLQPIFNSCLINIGDMLDNGTVINGKLIDSPKSFRVACTIVTQIIATVASTQYGGQAVDISHLGKYLRKSYEKFKRELEDNFLGKIPTDVLEEILNQKVKEELSSGVQTIQYQINTLMTTNGHCPLVSLFLYLKNDDPYIKENAMIIEEILKQRYDGLRDENGEYINPEFPKLIYVLDENNSLKGGEYDYLTKLALKCAKKTLVPSFISAKKMRENYSGNVFSPMGCSNFLSPWKDENGEYKFEGRFNQGIVSINLPQIAITSEGDENRFFELLEERLELCYEALMCRHYALLGTVSDTSPIHWKHGAIAHLKTGEKIDKYLKDGYSTISLGYVGIYEATKYMKGVSNTDPEGKEFALKIVKTLKEAVERWKKTTGIGFCLYGGTNEIVCKSFAKIDKEKFGTIQDITDKESYTSSYHVNKNEDIELQKKLSFESEFQKLSLGGGVSQVSASSIKNDDEAEDLVRFIYNNVQCLEYIG